MPEESIVGEQNKKKGGVEIGKEGKTGEERSFTTPLKGIKKLKFLGLTTLGIP